MIQSLYLNIEGDLSKGLTAEAMAAVVRDEEGVLWVDLCEEPAETCESLLRDVFAFHPLAVDDALVENHIPRVDDWDAYLYLVLHALNFDQRSDEPLGTVELDVFLGRNYLVTHRAHPIASVNDVWAASLRDKRHLTRGPAQLLYRVLDELVTGHMPVIEAIDEAIDTIEDQVFGDPDPATLQQIFTLKRALLRLRRIIGPQREVLNKLARGDYAVVATDERVFFRDVYDHLVRLHDMSESLRDLASSALDTYLSAVNNRMNEIMKVLTVITTLFMPLSFLAGFFGMNFFQPVVPRDAWTSQAAFLLVLAAMVLSPMAMAVWMRRRRWM
ncbi:MAG: magnesium/cobalt transporter CorA [Anaerolineae bacterium]|jgi:magnesium transporter